ncbi:hypothetical protein [Leptolyngbya sp. FACHB-321]|uniref:hypothetical protein n=1 Tax=Leptolyngbya sp. FACHB-321 TaxID=2692807 RepID=UPI0016854C68|nr:hypothetical protein [Leptolyngbya sp. FACHB-321]
MPEAGATIVQRSQVAKSTLIEIQQTIALSLSRQCLELLKDSLRLEQSAVFLRHALRSAPN